MHDGSKVIREAKKICDHHIEAGLGCGSVDWGIHICGLKMRIESVNMFRDGLYIAACQATLCFPQNVDNLPDFINTLKELVFLIERTEVQATELIGLYDKIYKSFAPALNQDTSMCSEGIFTTSPTYYTPPSENRAVSAIPTELFINAKRQLFQEKVIIGEGPSESSALDMEGDADIFGWLERSDGTWYNMMTGETSEEPPYE
jgi:hypothetical protein